jgi:hypothetical protein
MIKRIINTIFKVFGLRYTIEPTSYIEGMRDNMSNLRSSISQKDSYISLLENLNQKQFTIPKNFDLALKQINELTDKARATFYYRLVNGIPEEDLEVLQRYVHLKTRENQL